MGKTITPEVRQSIFALYINQPIAHHNDLVGVSGCTPADIFGTHSEQHIESYHLNLKPISLLQDKHAAVIGEILGFTIELVSNGRAFCKQIDKKGRMTFHFHPLNTLECFDFLRSRGYAIPYRNFTVEELISAKVFQLTN